MAMPQNKSSTTAAHEEQCRRAAGLENQAWNCGKGNGGAMPNLDKQNIKINGGALQLASNRRALGDIGNLVGALSARCIVSKDAAMKNNNQENIPIVDSKKGERSIGRSRKFHASSDEEEKVTQSDMTLSGRIKQQRTMGGEGNHRHHHHHHHHQQQQQQHSALKSSLTVKMQHTMTSTLNSRCSSEAYTYCGASCIEVEMEEADEIPSWVENLDEEDAGNPLAVVDYVEDIYDFYRKTEMQSCVPADYMSHQYDINEKMRAILIDWLIEVHLKFKLMPETLYLTINLIDRFLARQTVVRKNLQLVGITAMMLACKYEEIWAPEVKDFVYISDKAYTKGQVLDMEKQMLNELQFNLTVPTPYVFLVRFLKAADSDTQLEMLSFFFTELCLVEYCMVEYCPSHLAAAAVYTAQHTLNRIPKWSTTLRHHSGYTETYLRDCAMKMVKFHHAASRGNLTVVHKKYASPKFGCVATLGPSTLLP